jgi:membrane protease YdiL (CAAX protease family)
MFTKEVFAQSSVNLSYFTSFLQGLQNILNTLVPLLFGLAIVFFFWGLVKFLWNAGSEEAKDEGKRIMIWGVIAIAVMASVYGLVAVLQNIFLGGASTTTISVPRLPGY